MIARVVAWVIVLALAGMAWKYSAAWSSPWGALTASPVLSQLPKASNGCGEKCK